MMDLPDALEDVEVVVTDFTTGEEIATGRCDFDLTEQKDRYGNLRSRFSGVFRPAKMADVEALKRRLLAGFSAGTVAHNIILTYGDRTYSFTVKFEVGDRSFPFTGRARPAII